MKMPVCKADKKPCLSNRITAAWMIAALLPMLCASAALVNEAAQFAVLPMGALALIALFDRSFCLHRLFWDDRRGRRGLALLLTAAFFLLLSLPNLLNCPLFSERGLSAVWWRYRWERLIYLAWNWFVFLPSYVFAVYACMHTALCAALDRNDVGESSQKFPNKIRFVGLYSCIIPLILCCVAILFSSAPSLFIGDAPTVWYGARDNLWNEWHTAGYMLFVKLCSLIYNGQRAVTLVQTVACLYIHNYALTRLIEAGCGRKTCYAYLAVVMVSFVPLYFLQAIIKDVVFSLSLFAFSLGVLSVVQQADQPRKRDLVFMAFFGLCTTLFRHAGWLPVGCALAGLILYLLCRRSRAVFGVLAAGAGVAVCSVLIVNVLAYRVMNFERNPAYIAYSAPMTMIGAVAASGEEITPEDRAMMERIMPKEKWAACYNPYFADTLSRPYGAIGSDVEKIGAERLGGELIRLNLRFLLTHTKTYCKAFFDLNSLMWEIATPADGYVRSYMGYPLTSISELVAAEGYAEDGLDNITKELKQAEDTTFTAFAPIVNRYAELLYGLPVTRALFWRGGFACFVLLFSAVVLIKKRRAQTLLALIPVAAMIAGMLFSMPAQEVRYVFANLLCAGFFGVYACGVKAKPHEK